MSLPLAIATPTTWMRAEADGPGWVLLAGRSGASAALAWRQALGVRWFRQGSWGGQPTPVPDGDLVWTWQQARLDAGVLVLSGEAEHPRAGAWRAVTTATPAADGALRVDTVFTCLRPAMPCCVRVSATPLAHPATCSEVIPGVCYGGNPADVVISRGYCPTLTEAEMRELRLHERARRITADIPRRDVATAWTVHIAGHSPAGAEVAVLDRAAGTALHLGFSRDSAVGPTGVVYTADPLGGTHRLTVEAPCMRSRRYQTVQFVGSGDTAHAFAVGAQAGVATTVELAAANGMPDLVAGCRHGRERRRAGLAVPAVLPRSQAVASVVTAYDRVNWREDLGYYRCGAGGSPNMELQLGWVFGSATLVALDALGDATTKARVRRMLDFVIKRGQAPSGLFYGCFDGERWIDHRPWNDWLAAITPIPRRTTDTVHQGFVLLDRLRAGAADDQPLADRWEASLRRAVEALATVWRRDHDLPYLLDPDTGEALWRGSCGGTLAIAVLAEAAQRWVRPDLLADACALAEHYRELCLETGQTWGGCSDILNAIDEESCQDLCIGLTRLARLTGEARHLAWARQAVDLLATWVLDEDLAFPAGSRFARNGVHPFGAVVASTQNAVGVPGLCIDSGAFLLELYELCNDPFLLDLLSDISRACPQMVVRPGTDWGPLLPGQMTECLAFSDTWGVRGEPYLHEASWSAAALLLNHLEVPSVYLDGDRAWCFDHLEVAAGQVHNPTAVPATCTIRRRGGATRTVTLQPGATAAC